jgi:hypothetical protein
MDEAPGDVRNRSTRKLTHPVYKEKHGLSMDRRVSSASRASSVWKVSGP